MYHNVPFSYQWLMPCTYTFGEDEAKQDLPLCNYNNLSLGALDKNQILMKAKVGRGARYHVRYLALN